MMGVTNAFSNRGVQTTGGHVGSVTLYSPIIVRVEARIYPNWVMVKDSPLS